VLAGLHIVAALVHRFYYRDGVMREVGAVLAAYLKKASENLLKAACGL